MVRRSLIASCLALSLLVGILVPLVGANSWFGSWTRPSLDVNATCTLARARSVDTSVSVWAGVGGMRFLDIIQVGAMTFPDGRVRYFAAWGNGNPGTDGSSYTQVDLGPATRGWHRYGLRLSEHVWSLRIDGRLVQRVSDSFRHWHLFASETFAEGEGNRDRIGGGMSCIYGSGWYVTGTVPVRSVTTWHSWIVR